MEEEFADLLYGIIHSAFIFDILIHAHAGKPYCGVSTGGRSIAVEAGKDLSWSSGAGVWTQ
jgi:hypothetical protein